MSDLSHNYIIEISIKLKETEEMKKRSKELELIPE